MKQNGTNSNQVSLILRLLGGGYLLYTAWDLRGAFQEGPLYIIFAALFALVGAVLLGGSVYQLVKSGTFFGNTPAVQDEEAKESNEINEEDGD